MNKIFRIKKKIVFQVKTKAIILFIRYILLKGFC